mmetsp:Transcript_42929/g.78016  ORF Transcript_42929/g.78016 Transcript_42929/m.78016 type:complete len:106 (-) Transcript_42929:27-344(-)
MGRSSKGGRSASTALGASIPAEITPATAAELDSNVAGNLESCLDAALLADGKKASCMQLHAHITASMHGTNALRRWLREHLPNFMGNRRAKAGMGMACTGVESNS